MWNVGHALTVCSLLFFLFAAYAVLASALLPSTRVPLLDALAQDTHYKYFVLFSIPLTAYFAIANWIGWQYYTNS